MGNSKPIHGIFLLGIFEMKYVKKETIIMSKKKFIQERLEKLEDINEFLFKGGRISSTGEYTMSDITYNLLPILKDLIEANIGLKNEMKQIKETRLPNLTEGEKRFLERTEGDD